MMAGSPLSPPLITEARPSMRYLLFGFSPLWHLTQDFSRIGLMSFSYARPFLSEAGGNLAASHSAFFLSFSAPIRASADRQNAAATRVQKFPPKPWGRRPDFMVRVFMADISTKDDSAVKKIHLKSTDRWAPRNTVNFLWHSLWRSGRARWLRKQGQDVEDAHTGFEDHGHGHGHTSQFANSSCTETPFNSNNRRIASSIKLFGHEAPAVIPTVILPDGSQSRVSTSCCRWTL